MKLLVIGLVVLEIIISIFMLHNAAKNKKSPYYRSFCLFVYCVIASQFSYLLFITIPNKTVAQFFIDIHFISINWILVFLLIFKANVTSFKNKIFSTNSFITFICLWSVIDSLSLFFDFILNHAIQLIPVTNDMGFVGWCPIYKLGYSIHMILCYFLIANFIGISIGRIIKLTHTYQRKYVQLHFSVLLVIVVNIFYQVLKWPYDYAVLFYLLSVLVFYNFAFLLFPNEQLSIATEQVTVNINTPILVYDIYGKCIFINKAASEIFRSKDEDSPLQFEDAYFLRWQRRFDSLTDGIVKDFDVFSINGVLHTYESELMSIKDDKNRNIGYFVKLEDKTRDIIALKQERYLATHDNLTGLRNKDSFYDKATRILRESPEIPRYLISTDIENFKLINDLFGEEIGNEILLAQAQMLNLAVYPDCVKGRIAGDKFAMLIRKENFNPDLMLENTRKVQRILVNKYKYYFRICIGIYEIADSFEDVRVMLSKANMAIGEIRDDFTKSTNFYSITMMQQLISEKNILNEFPYALENNQFCLYIQPQFSAKDQKVLGGEALVRWNHPVKGIMNPNSFVKVLEKNNYISNLDLYIWEEAVKKLAEWKRYGYTDFYISVNISAKDFYFRDLFEIFTGLVEKYGINPKNLNLEVTETVLMYNVEKHKSVLSKLRNYGFTIEMDDFGSGYSSLSTLRNLNMDVLKIDMEFLHETENYEQSMMIINAIIELAKSLDMTVITEGVELKNQADLLTKMGCDIFQGYYFSRPIPMEDFEARYIRKEIE